MAERDRKKEVVIVEAKELRDGDSIQVVHNGLMVMAEIDKHEEVGDNVILTINIFTSNEPISVTISLNKSIDVVTFEEVYYREVNMRY